MKMVVKSWDKVLLLSGHEDHHIVLVEKIMVDHQDKIVKSVIGVDEQAIGLEIALNWSETDIILAQDSVPDLDQDHDLIDAGEVLLGADPGAEIENIAGEAHLTIVKRVEV